MNDRVHPRVAAAGDAATRLHELFARPACRLRAAALTGGRAAAQAVEDAAAPLPGAARRRTHDAAASERLLLHTHSGGVTVNDWAWHVINHDAPFGGSGNSGMGSYHGAEGFRELSHARTVLIKNRFFPIGLFYPPYGNLVQRLALRLFVGRADSGLRP